MILRVDRLGVEGGQPVFTRDALLAGIQRVEDAFTNWYIIEADDGLTIVDAGVPSAWDSLLAALEQLVRPIGHVRPLLLTHAHFDHVGFAERLRAKHNRRYVRYGDEGVLPVPGNPVIVATPGHTLGHCALHLPDRDVLIAGDAIVALDPYTGRTGPRLVARAATVEQPPQSRKPGRAGGDRREDGTHRQR